jgi:hypothetical protein
MAVNIALLTTTAAKSFFQNRVSVLYSNLNALNCTLSTLSRKHCSIGVEALLFFVVFERRYAGSAPYFQGFISLLSVSMGLAVRQRGHRQTVAERNPQQILHN